MTIEVVLEWEPAATTTEDYRAEQIPILPADSHHATYGRRALAVRTRP
jgi:hypothetical protein